MNQFFKNNFVLIINIIKIVILIILYVYSNILLFFIVPLILIFILIFEIIIMIKFKKYKIVFIIFTIILFIGILPIMELGNYYGITFGNQIKYNENIWKNTNNDNLKYYMAEDIINIITKNNYLKNDIIKMLGKPDLGNNLYYLKRNSLFSAFDVYFLLIEYDNEKIKSAEIINLE